MNDLQLHMTAMNRILIHLMDFRIKREEFEAPVEVTQSGISRAIKIQQKHLPRTLKKLLGMNYVEEKVTHVKGVKQKRKVYFLTEEGIQYSWEFINNLMMKNIPQQILTDSEVDEKSIEQIQLEKLYKRDKDEFSLLQILLFLEENGYYDKEVLKFRCESETLDNGGFGSEKPSDIITKDSGSFAGTGVIHPKSKSLGSLKISKSVKHDIYYTVLKQAWRDGQITEDERDILTELQNKLDISAEEHHQIELEIMSARDRRNPDSEKIYKAALKQAWVDGVITEDEDSLLKELRRSLNISEEQHEVFEKEMKMETKAK